MRRGYYKGSEPCPNCGSGESRAKKNGVCPTCEKVFELGKQYKKILDLQSEKSGLKNIGFRMIRGSAPDLFLPDELHFDRQSYARYARRPGYLSAHRRSDRQDINGEILAVKVNALLVSMDNGQKPGKTISYENAWGDAIVVSLPINQAKAFVYLYDYLSDYISEIEKEAKRSGQSLLINLAKKELEIADLG